jgi:hypothetical protein
MSLWFGQQARCVSQHNVAVAHLCWSWDPSNRHATFKQFVGGGCVIEKSDRPYPAKSGCIEDEVAVGRYSDNHIVGELILCDYVLQFGGRLSGEGPMHNLFKRAKRTDFDKNICGH